MLSENQKFEKAQKLSSILADIKLLEIEKGKLVDELAAYVKETGDTVFQWVDPPVRLTYVKGSPAKPTVDAKTFMTLAAKYMAAEDYATCTAQAVKMSGGRKPSFR